jgi:hypothetical protein
MASIQSIQSILQTYQKAYGAEELHAQLALFLKASSEPSAPAAEAPKKPRAVAEATKEWQSQMSQITAVYKKLIAASGQKMPAGSHLKVAGRIRQSGNASSFTEEDVAEAITFFTENPDFKSPTQARRAAKASDAASVASGEHSDAPSAASSEKKRGRPKMSEEDKTAKKAERDAARAAKKEEETATKAAEKEAKKAARAAEKEEKKAAKKAEKTSKKKGAAAEMPPLPESEDEAEDELYTEIEMGGVPYFWNEQSGLFYEREDDGSLTLCGRFDGETFSFNA